MPARTALRVNIEASLTTVYIDDTVCCSPKQRCSGSFRSVGRATFVSIINLPTSAHVKPRSRPSLPGQPARLGEHVPARTIGACGRCKLRINSRFQCPKTVPRQSRPYSRPARRPTWRSSILSEGTISPDIFVQSITEGNSAGVRPSGRDLSHVSESWEDGALGGEIGVSADISVSQVAKVQRTFGDAGAIRVSGG